MPAPEEPKCDRVLIVEGVDDLLFYAEVLEYLEPDHAVWIDVLGGKGNARPTKRNRLLDNLDNLLRPDRLLEKRAFGVLVDADADASATAASLETRLAKLTGQVVKNGAWTDGAPRIGLYVVPGDGRAGEIETVVWEAWSNDPVNLDAKARVDAYLEGMSALGKVPKSLDKGRLGALFAVLNDEDPRLGPSLRLASLRKGILDRPELTALRGFFHELVTP